MRNDVSRIKIATLKILMGLAKVLSEQTDPDHEMDLGLDDWITIETNNASLEIGVRIKELESESHQNKNA